MNYKTIKLNDLYYDIKCNLESYYQTWLDRYLLNAIVGYYWYKKRRGKKVIERLENELIKNELTYI